MAKSVTVKFGPGNEMTRELPDGDNIGCILENPNFQSGLGFGANVVAKIDGVEMRKDFVPRHGTKVTIETRAHEKARRS
jgi:hypothetical protein